MKKIADIKKIIQRYKDGWNDTQIANEYHMSRNTVRKYKQRYLEAETKLNDSQKNIEQSEVNENLINKPKYDSSNRKAYKYTQEMDDYLNSLIKKEEEEKKRLGPDYQPIRKTQYHQKMREAGFNIGYTTISRKIDEKRLAKINLSPWKDR